MIIKKFQGKTKQEALENARRELGENIVEMNSKTIKAKGLLGIFKGTKVEVTVAKEDENEKKYTQQEEVREIERDGVAVSIGQGNAQGKIIPMKKSEKGEQRQEITDARAVGQAVADVLSAFPAQRPDTSRTDNVRTGNDTSLKENLRGRGIEEKLDNLQNLLEKQLNQQEGRVQPADLEVEEKKIEKPKENRERINFLKVLYRTMRDNEITEKYAKDIIDEIDKNCKEDVTLDFMLSEIYQRMILRFGKPYIIEESENKPKVIFFVGPTGVGKTTTIAKIASSFRVEHKKKVALLTADTYRIAAAEQLRTYANILEVPFRVIYTAKEITEAMEDFREYDYILVDTTGHAPNNEAQCESISDLIGTVDMAAQKEVFLVLSASTNYRDLMKIADTYKEICDYKLIFTKLDETSTLGNIYNLKLYTGAALSYVTCGQNVPYDIEYFNPQSTVKQLLGGRR